MYQSKYQEYRDAEVLSAEPIKLVQILYRGALDQIAGARRALVLGDIATRSRLIVDASAILNELARTLDHSKDPDLCRNLVELYDYMLRCLMEANVKQIEQPLVEVEGLLGSILEAWVEAGRQEETFEVSSYTASAYSGDTGAQYRQFSYA